MMRVVVTIAGYLAALAVVTATVLIVVIFVAGPHAGVLPQWAEIIVIGLGWLAVFVLPVLVARRLWRRLGL